MIESMTQRETEVLQRSLSYDVTSEDAHILARFIDWYEHERIDPAIRRLEHLVDVTDSVVSNSLWEIVGILRAKKEKGK